MLMIFIQTLAPLTTSNNQETFIENIEETFASKKHMSFCKYEKVA